MSVAFTPQQIEARLGELAELYSDCLASIWSCEDAGQRTGALYARRNALEDEITHFKRLKQAALDLSKSTGVA